MPQSNGPLGGLFRRRPTAPDSAATQDRPPLNPATTMVDAGIYVDGRRVASPKSFQEAFHALDDHPDGFAWLGLFRPSATVMNLLAKEFDLSPLAVEDTIIAHQRPKLERYGDTLFMVLRAAKYHDLQETVDFGEVHAFVGDRFVISIRHAESPDFSHVRSELEATPELLSAGPGVVMMRLLDVIVDEYMPVVRGIENDIEEIDAQVFTGNTGVGKRIYQLTREVIDFQRAVRPIGEICKGLRRDRLFTTASEDVRQHLRDIEDHSIVVSERTEAMRDALASVLTLHSTLQSQAVNEQMKEMSEAALKQGEDTRRIAAWAGVIFMPTLITGIYGMNFDRMPELHWALGYPLALVMMVVAAVVMYFIFKWQKWL